MNDLPAHSDGYQSLHRSSSSVDADDNDYRNRSAVFDDDLFHNTSVVNYFPARANLRTTGGGGRVDGDEI